MAHGEICGLFSYLKTKGGNEVATRKNKRIYTTDVWEQWKKDGKTEEVLAFIVDCAKKLISQHEMCKYLKIEDHTF